MSSGIRGSRRARVAGACLLQLGLVALVVAPSLSARLTGEEYRLAVAPVDPVDPFRGAYVVLDYPGLADVLPEDGSAGTGTVFVPLEPAPDGGTWRGGRGQRQRPGTGPYLRCRAEARRVVCGIESFFASQDRARELERALLDGAVARIRVDGRGHAAVVAVEPRG